MIEVNRIISDLEEIKKRPNMYIQPVTPEILVCFLSGLERGVLLSVEALTFHDIVEARRATKHTRGWKDHPRSSYHEMREKGIAESDIIQELVEIEIEMWKILEKQNN